MLTVLVRVCGDYWINQEEVRDQLQKNSAETRVLFQVQEGTSLEYSGISNFIKCWQESTQRADSDILISCVNHQDVIPWKNIHPDRNGCWSTSKKFYTDQIHFVDSAEKTFGYFVGRRSIARNVILYDCAHTWPGHFLLSRTVSAVPEPWNQPNCPEDFAEWIDIADTSDIMAWVGSCGIGSVDNSNQRDQFDPHKNPNSSMLQHYHRFLIELVSETMTRGRSFFPTEKITRPITGHKPFLVYAAKNYLYNLRKLGFQTFGDLWDESYDQFEGVERWKKMKSTIQYIIDHPEVVRSCQSIVEHNHLRLRGL